MKLIMISIIAMLLPLLSYAQVSNIKPLKVGDIAPNVNINNVVNYKATSARLSDFNGKLVILDFMNTYCLTCIKALPVFDSLQHKYNGRLQIFIVTNEPKKRAAFFLKTNPIARYVTLPFIVNDSVLEKLFPHAFVSHEVWIYNGMVKAITDPDYVTEENIHFILSGRTPNWKIKTDKSEFNYNESFIKLTDNIAGFQIGKNVYHSIGMPHLNGVGVRYIDDVDSLNGVRTIRAINYDIAHLYLQALTKGRFPISHVLMDATAEDTFAYTNKNEYRNVWEEKNTWCYEATFPANTREDVVRKKIQSDLDAYLKVESSFEIKNTTCYLLMPDSGFTLTSFPKGDYNTVAALASNDDLVFMSPRDLITKLNDTYWGVPFYYEVEPTIPIHFILPSSILTNINTLRSELKKQHFILKEITKDVNVLLLKKN